MLWQRASTIDPSTRLFAALSVWAAGNQSVEAPPIVAI
jgi:hypothetical protein